jgi:hypothetical protein
MTAVWSFRTLFFVIPNACEESSVWMLRFAQHDKLVDACAPFSMTAVWSFRTLFFVIPNACEESTYGCFASLSMTDRRCHSEHSFLSFRASARNPVRGCFASLSMTNWWMLHFVQHDSRVVIPSTLFCHSERLRGIHLWMLRFAQHDRPMSFRASARNPLMDASLRSA